MNSTMVKTIVLHSDKCIGCRSCEAACSLTNEGEINPVKSRISIITFLEDKYSLPYHFIGSCRQCVDAPCFSECPVEAISRADDDSHKLVIHSDRCIGCGKCVRACPFGAMKFDSELKKAFKCELCDGDPACVNICPAKAIEYLEQEPLYAYALDYQMQGHGYLAEQNKERIKLKKTTTGREK